MAIWPGKERATARESSAEKVRLSPVLGRRRAGAPWPLGGSARWTVAGSRAACVRSVCIILVPSSQSVPVGLCVCRAHHGVSRQRRGPARSTDFSTQAISVRSQVQRLRCPGPPGSSPRGGRCLHVGQHAVHERQQLVQGVEARHLVRDHMLDPTCPRRRRRWAGRETARQRPDCSGASAGMSTCAQAILLRAGALVTSATCP